MTKSAKTTNLKVRKAAEKRQQQMQQRLIMVGVGVAVIIVAVLAILTLAPKGTSTVGGADRYANIPSGVTKTGPNASVSYPYDAPYIGSPSAPVKIEEIGSFSCPICMLYHDRIFVNLIDEVQSGKLQYIFLPTTETGDFNAVPGTMAGYCAAKQGKFWAMHDRLYQDQSQYGASAPTLTHINADAAAIGLDTSQFSSCLNTPEATQYVQSVNDYANIRGLVGTPTIFLYVNGQQVIPPNQRSQETVGSMADLPLDQLRTVIDTGKIS